MKKKLLAILCAMAIALTTISVPVDAERMDPGAGPAAERTYPNAGHADRGMRPADRGVGPAAERWRDPANRVGVYDAARPVDAGNWGWLGLIGLAGLFAFRKRDGENR